jgi:chromosome segregation ATPase
MSQNETPAESRKSAMDSDYAALYAVAGLTDALAEALKGALAETQQKASKRLTELQSKRPELSQQAKASAEELRTFVITLPEQFKHLPEATKARIAELQQQANDLMAQATTTYGELAERGKHAVDEARRSTRDRPTRAVTPRTSDNASDGQDSQEGQS